MSPAGDIGTARTFVPTGLQTWLGCLLGSRVNGSRRAGILRRRRESSGDGKGSPAHFAGEISAK